MKGRGGREGGRRGGQEQGARSRVGLGYKLGIGSQWWKGNYQARMTPSKYIMSRTS